MPDAFDLSHARDEKLTHGADGKKNGCPSSLAYGLESVTGEGDSKENAEYDAGGQTRPVPVRVGKSVDRVLLAVVGVPKRLGQRGDIYRHDEGENLS